jgi:hypothetical protein
MNRSVQVATKAAVSAACFARAIHTSRLASMACIKPLVPGPLPSPAYVPGEPHPMKRWAASNETTGTTSKIDSQMGGGPPATHRNWSPPRMACCLDPQHVGNMASPLATSCRELPGKGFQHDA